MECPPEFEELWGHYQNLAATRQWHPGPQAISYQEIEAYNRDNCVYLTLYERAILREVDTKVIPQIGKKLQKRMKQSKTGDKEPEVIDAGDAKGVKGLFRTMGSIMQAKKRKT